ncbi:LPS translocon maturation chaperone LptM [Dentiradicibacter hellwigii]|uniref:Lipoprotein n=1 Tax=Dentiradicibacter hellwigii TaxID=3149053 RepID=A0ABV4UG13_9RHOO
MFPKPAHTSHAHFPARRSLRISRCFSLLLPVIAVACGVSACGTRGPLTLPPQSAQKAAPPAPTPTNTNTNTPQDASR